MKQFMKSTPGRQMKKYKVAFKRELLKPPHSKIKKKPIWKKKSKLQKFQTPRTSANWGPVPSLDNLNSTWLSYKVSQSRGMSQGTTY